MSEALSNEVLWTALPDREDGERLLPLMALAAPAAGRLGISDRGRWLFVREERVYPVGEHPSVGAHLLKMRRDEVVKELLVGLLTAGEDAELLESFPWEAVIVGGLQSSYSSGVEQALSWIHASERSPAVLSAMLAAASSPLLSQPTRQSLRRMMLHIEANTATEVAALLAREGIQAAAAASLPNSQLEADLILQHSGQFFVVELKRVPEGRGRTIASALIGMASAISNQQPDARLAAACLTVFPQETHEALEAAGVRVFEHALQTDVFARSLAEWVRAPTAAR